MRLSLLFFTFLLAGNDLLLGRGAPLTKASAPVSKTAAHVLRVHSKLSGKVMEVLIQSETLAEADQRVAEFYQRSFIDSLATADNPLAAHVNLARFNYFSAAIEAKKLEARRRARGDVAALATGGLLSSKGVQSLLEDITGFKLKADEDIYNSLKSSEVFLAEFGDEELLKGLDLEAFTAAHREQLEAQEIETLAEYYSRVPHKHRTSRLEGGDIDSKSINAKIAGLARIGNAQAVQDIALDGVIATLLHQELTEMGVAQAIDGIANIVIPDADFWKVIYGAAKSGELFAEWEALRQDSNDHVAAATHRW